MKIQVLGRAKTVAHRPGVGKRSKSEDNSLNIFDSGRHYSFRPGEEDVAYTEKCPQELIDAIRLRLERVQMAEYPDDVVQLFVEDEEGIEKIENTKEVEEEKLGRRAQEDDSKLDHGSDTAQSLEEAQLQIQVLERENKMLRNCLSECINHTGRILERDYGVPERDSTSRQLEVLMERLTASERQRAHLERQVRELGRILSQHDDLFRMLINTRLSSNDKSDCEPILRFIRTELEEHRLLSESLGPALTIRGVLMLKMLQHQQPETSQQSHAQAPNDLDQVLTLEEATNFSTDLNNRPELLNPKTTSLRICSLCKHPRFLRFPPITASSSGLIQPLLVNPPFGATTTSSSSSFSSFSPPGNHEKPLSEFNASPTGLTPCCRHPICDACYLPALLSSLTPSLWRNLTSHRWLRCPVPSCNAPLPVSHDAELATVLRACHDPDITMHVDMFERAGRLRAVLSGIRPVLGAEELVRAGEVHEILVGGGWMRDLTAGWETDNARVVVCAEEGFPTSERDVELLPVLSADGGRVLSVPVFTSLFIRPVDGRECLLCYTPVRDVTDGSREDEERWCRTVEAVFPGDWTWQVRTFPPGSALPVCAATHELGMCRACLGMYIARRVAEMGDEVEGEGEGEEGSDTESEGESEVCETPTTNASVSTIGVGRRWSGFKGVMCPMEGCKHVYTSEEVRKLVGRELFEQYVRLVGDI